MKFQGRTNFNHATPEKLGILITNLGTPEAATPSALRKYLAEFLWDPRVVEFPRPLWWLVLHLVILRIRPRKSAATYAKIWTDQGSPLMLHTRAQMNALRNMLDAYELKNIEVEFAMRYGKPSIESALQALQNKNVTRLVVLPLYPQYSGSTTGSTFDALGKVFSKLRWIPELRFVNQYSDDENYIHACANQIKRYWQKHTRSQVLLFSFHGLPKRYLLAGDPYYCQCNKTARLIAKALDLHEFQWKITFQSRFGREEWLQPYTDKTLEAMPKDNIKSVDVFCPGFSADCVETLEEIDMLNREIFIQAGGEQFQYIPALNDSPEHIQAIYKIAIKHMQGWNNITSSELSQIQQEKDRTQQWAIKLGAAQ